MFQTIYNIKIQNKFSKINFEPKKFSNHGKNKYWEIYMTQCSTFRYVQNLVKTRSTVIVLLWAKTKVNFLIK